MPTTSNFGWTTPADTDLVKDGAAAIRTLGNGIDSSLVDLKGGTTGQILSKASNTDLDYTWIANDQGDITEVSAGTGISVASGTGPVPVVTNTVATTFDAKGDLVVGTGADTFAKLTVGANNTVLTADSTTATGLKWAAAAGPTFTTYTPSFTNLTVGNGTVTAASATNGDLVTALVRVEFGSTTSVSGEVQFTLPSNAHSTMNAQQFLAGSFTDSGVRTISNIIQIKNTLDAVFVKYQDDAAGFVDVLATGSTAPFTWSTNDVMIFLFTYRKA